ncbi:glycosyltransferase family 4 protein [Candidatus Poribacteria bacterium]|nr:glycosyltransferase family 4 protein [Candidatus Poribacteria bacterium]
MKIAYIAAGAAGMYCGTCIHDNTLAAALQRKGHDVALIPTYTPIRTDEADVSIDRVFYGGINVYLQQKSALFRHTPWMVDRLFDSPSLLNGLTRLSASTSAQDLGALTVSVLQGEEGQQKKELEKLVKWLKDSYQPDLVQLTNSMFVGFAREMKKVLGVPILCALQGEDIFLEDLIEPYKSQALNLLRARASEVDGYLAPCQYYADFMAEYLDVPENKIDVVRLGLNLSEHGVAQKHLDENPFVIGYLARICPEKGLHLLADAFHRLTSRFGSDNLRLKVAGYLGKNDEPYLEQLVNQIDAWGLSETFDYWGEVDRHQKITFLNGLHVLSVPTTYKESKGLFILEALANGVPVVQPRHGSFPEFIAATGGGILVDTESPDAIAEGISQLMSDRDYREQLGQRGKEAVHSGFSDDVMAEATLAVYQKYIG